jgi:glycosyltransferase involved in cell wall biosynthesis
VIRVLDVITTPQGASRLLARRVGDIGSDPDFENAIACPADPSFTDAFAPMGIRFFPIAMDRGIGPVSAIGETGAFLRILREYEPDIVHSHTSKAGAVARVACAIANIGRKRRIASIYQVHSFYFNAFSGVKRFVYRALEVFLSRMTDLILFQNDFELEQARAAGMGKRARLVGIGNGVDLSEFPPASAPKRHPGKDSPFTLICVARVEPKKNHRMLLEAMRILRVEMGKREARLVCVGEIGDAQIVGEAERMGLRDAVSFVGMRPRSEISGILEEGQVAVLASLAEGKPRALMEAMLQALPCVATKVVGTDEVVRDGEDGFLVSVDDAHAMAQRISQLIEEPDLYETFSARALERARIQFNEARVVAKLKEIYKGTAGVVA